MPLRFKCLFVFCAVLATVSAFMAVNAKIHAARQQDKALPPLFKIPEFKFPEPSPPPVGKQEPQDPQKPVVKDKTPAPVNPKSVQPPQSPKVAGLELTVENLAAFSVVTAKTGSSKVKWLVIGSGQEQPSTYKVDDLRVIVTPAPGTTATVYCYTAVYGVASDMAVVRIGGPALKIDVADPPPPKKVAKDSVLHVTLVTDPAKVFWVGHEGRRWTSD